MMMKLISFFFCFFCFVTAKAQSTDTLSVVAYNLLNFPSSSPTRVDTLEVIVQHLDPDILMVCELTSAGGAVSILNNALNVDGISSYAQADFVEGPDTQNILFYNTEKLGLFEQNEISTSLRNINEYVLYHKADDIATTGDTVFFYVYVCHFKAGTGFEAQRDGQADDLKTYIAGRPKAENIIIGGDFNLYGSDTEPAWNTILEGAGVTIKDPIVSPGHWNSNSAYAPIHTQSTRTTSFDGGATGGIDDRFDIIFVGEDLKNYSNDAKYINGTYRAVGQDALHFNDALIDPPMNTSEPWPVITALYHMSDHLPVYMEVEVIKEFAGISEEVESKAFFFDSKSGVIHCSIDEAAIYSIGGRFIRKVKFGMTDVNDLGSGLYILKSNGEQLKFVVD